MLYSTLPQPLVFLCLFCSGLAGGVIFEFARLVSFLCNKNKIVLQIGYFFSAICCTTIFFFVNLLVNYGELRLFAIFAFVVAVMLEHFIFANLFAKLAKLCYTKIVCKKKKEKKFSK